MTRLNERSSSSIRTQNAIRWRMLFRSSANFCTTKSKCNVFLVSQSLAGPVRAAIDQLIDLRLIHPVKSRVTLKQGGTELFEAYMLDLSQYSAARKLREFDIRRPREPRQG